MEDPVTSPDPATPPPSFSAEVEASIAAVRAEVAALHAELVR